MKKPLYVKLLKRQLVPGIIVCIISAVIVFVIFINALTNMSIDNYQKKNTLIINNFSNIIDTAKFIATSANNDHELLPLMINAINSPNRSEQELLEKEVSLYIHKYTLGYNLRGAYRFVTILLDSGELFSSPGLPDSYADFFESIYFLNYKNDGLSYYLSPILKSDDPDINDHIVFCAPYRKGNSDYTGTVSIFISVGQIANVFQNATINEPYYDVKLLDYYGNEVFSSTSDDHSVITSDICNTLISNYSYITEKNNIRNKNYVICASVKDRGILTLISAYDLNHTFFGFNHTFILIVLTYVLIILTVVTVTYFSLKKSIYPITILSRHMKSVTDDNSLTAVHINATDEVADLCNSYNNMISKIKHYISQKQQEEKDKHLLKYSLLISQIDPHFIYNTMNNINYLAKNGETEKIIKINTSLITLLKDKLAMSDIKVLDTVTHEISICKNYIEIQRCRYGDHFDVDFKIYDQTDDLLIPKNIIQPLIENAIFHGLMGNKTSSNILEGGYIGVYVKRSNYLKIIVENDGYNISKETLNKINQNLKNDCPRNNIGSGKHIGLRNIADRLHYLLGDAFEIQLNPRNPLGIVAVIDIKKEPCDYNISG